MLKKPYKGDGKYIFISYSHRNTKEVQDFIETLQNNGYNVWYDEGIEPSADWDKTIIEKIEGCSLFLILASREYEESEYCIKELEKAMKISGIEILTICMDDISPANMRGALEDKQAIVFSHYTRDEFYERVSSAAVLEPFKK